MISAENKESPLKHNLLTAFCLSVFCLALHAQTSRATQPTPQQGGALPPASKIDPAKQADILRFMQLTGGDEVRLGITRQVERQVRSNLETALPPGEYRAKLIDLFVADYGTRLTNEVVLPALESIYDKGFSEEELKQLIAFYESPLGKKASSVLGQIDAQISAMHKQSEALAEKCMQQVLDQHPDLAEALDKAEQAQPH